MIKTPIFEATTCSRCGGTGTYSFSSMYGRVCFGCRGAGYKHTKRGAAAYKVYCASLCKPVEAIEVGDIYRWDGFTAGSLTVRDFWVVVDSVEPTASGGIRLVGRVNKAGGESATADQGPGAMIRVARTNEFKKAKLQEALAYQATLTKQGVPSKAKKAAT